VFIGANVPAAGCFMTAPRHASARVGIGRVLAGAGGRSA